jgi:hypothetical protein
VEAVELLLLQQRLVQLLVQVVLVKLVVVEDLLQSTAQQLV